MQSRCRRLRCAFVLILFSAAAGLSRAGATQAATAKVGDALDAAPWMNARLSPDKRAEILLTYLSLDEKIALVHGEGVGGRDVSSLGAKDYAAYRADPEKFWMTVPKAPGCLSGDGCVRGIKRLGVPSLQMVGGGLGVTGGVPATALPSSLAKTASWDLKVSHLAGDLIGDETARRGFNVSLGGGMNLITDPEGGRDFEYQSEDPVLAGEMEAQELRGIQEHHVIATIKHFAFNNMETDRCIENSIVGERVMRETELLAFELAIKESNVGAVMCAYNKVNGTYTCENANLLTQVLKKEWGFKGWVMSDWGAAHSTVGAAMAGLDDEEGTEKYFASSLERAVREGKVPMGRLDEMVKRKLRTMFSLGLFEHPTTPSKFDKRRGDLAAQLIEEEGIVLLRNSEGILPLSEHVRSIAVIGGHADVGVLSGGGSSQVLPAGYITFPGDYAIWDPSPPLAAIRSRAAKAQVRFASGDDVSAAARLAASSDVAIVFAVQHRTESLDVPLALPNGQDDLISRIAQANSHTIVVLETGGAVLMPWIDHVAAVLEAWYPGGRGGPAIAHVLFGDVNPSGKLPITMPRSAEDLPEPYKPVVARKATLQDLLLNFRAICLQTQLFDRKIVATPSDDVHYGAGLRIGYKWYDAKDIQPLFPFGYGLSYSAFEYSNLRVAVGRGRDAGKVRLHFEIHNSSKRDGAEVAQIYVGLPSEAREPPKRLVAWRRQAIGQGDFAKLSVSINPKLLSIWDSTRQRWELLPGEYRIYIGGSSRDIRLQERVRL